MTLPAVYSGAVYGRWSLDRRIGKGGNGEVWLAEDGDGKKVAIKLLNKVKSIAYERFRAEVRVMSTCGVSGVVPIIDYDLPDQLGDRRAWYSMPLCTTLWERLQGGSLAEIVSAIATIAMALSDLEASGVFHRDVKPENMLWLDDAACIGDFGLVDYPEKQDLTGEREELGPRWTMAPEVRRMGRLADPGLADVYSLAKALWMFIRRDKKGFEGQYLPDTSLTIRDVSPTDFVDPLESLLSAATEHSPSDRPSMREFADGLRDWLRINDEWTERNRLEWRAVQKRIFPFSVPQRAEWHDVNDIVNVLRLLGERRNMNHMFFPDGGGLDLQDANASEIERGSIELIASGSVKLVRPLRLLFESFGDDPQWDYFRLETDGASPCGIYEQQDSRLCETVTEVEPGVYVDQMCWELNEYGDYLVADTARLITRYFTGAFVLFGKNSVYNYISSTYDGRHNRFDADGFRAYIQNLREAVVSRRHGDAATD